MAVNVAGNFAAHRQFLQVMRVTPSAKKWIHLVRQSSTRRVPVSSLTLGLKNSTSRKIPKSVVGVQAKTNGRAPAQDTCNVTLKNPEAVEDSPPSSATSQVTVPGSEKMENLVKLVPLHQLRQAEFLENRMQFRQKFVIRSYEVGADKTTSITTIFSFFQVSKHCVFLAPNLQI